MKNLLILIPIIALAACQGAMSDSSPVASRSQAVTSCRADFIAPALIDSYVVYGASCQIPSDSIRLHKDGSGHATEYGAGVAYSTWDTNDGNCDPRAWAISNVVHHAACLRNPPRWLYDTAYATPDTMSWGL